MQPHLFIPRLVLVPIHHLLTLDDDDAVGAVWAQPVAGHALVLAAVAGLAVDDLDGDDAVSVGDRVHRGVKRLAGLKWGDLGIVSWKKVFTLVHWMAGWGLPY